jgi:hypothetical protein
LQIEPLSRPGRALRRPVGARGASVPRDVRAATSIDADRKLAPDGQLQSCEEVARAYRGARHVGTDGLHRSDGTPRRTVNAAEGTERKGRDKGDAVCALRSHFQGARMRCKERLWECVMASEWHMRRAWEDAGEYDVVVEPRLCRSAVVSHINWTRPVRRRHRSAGSIDARLHHDGPTGESAYEEVGDDVARAVMSWGRHRRAHGVVVPEGVGVIGASARAASLGVRQDAEAKEEREQDLRQRWL